LSGTGEVADSREDAIRPRPKAARNARAGLMGWMVFGKDMERGFIKRS
jgi:hypothetical protein